MSGKQPRVPAGSPTGGRWSKPGGGGGASGGELRSFDNIEKTHDAMTVDQSWTEELTPREIEGVYKYTLHVGVNGDLRRGRPLSDNDQDFGSEQIPTDRLVLDHQGKPKLWEDGTPRYWTRAGNGVTDIESVAALDKAMAHPSAVLKEGIIVHRSWQGAGPNKVAGKVFTDKGFTSTAVVKSETDIFAVDRPDSVTQVEIHIPAGTRAIYLGKDKSPVKQDWDKAGKLHDRWYAGSTELLLDRGTRFKVVSSDKLPGPGVPRARNVVLEVVGQKKGPIE